jgi:hypothetical protein
MFSSRMKLFGYLTGKKKSHTDGEIPVGLQWLFLDAFAHCLSPVFG